MEQARQGPLQVGDKFLGKYEVLGLLGRGGYGYVYDCVDLFLGRAVALKICKPTSGGPSNVERQAQKEARALLLVSDERLVKLLDAGMHEGLVYLVMEKLNGRTLRDALREVGRLTVPEGLHVMLQVAGALSAAHGAGVIHRDVKPENIFLEADARVKVLDLGIAKVQGLGAQTTHKDGLRGTVLYMAPEQLQGHGVTPRTDVYALGVVAFEMLFRHYLYLGEAPPAYEEAAWRQISFSPPMLDELDPAIPHHVAKIVRRLLLKSPEQRYESMHQVIEVLDAALKRTHEEWHPQGRFIFRPLHAPLPPEAILAQHARPIVPAPTGLHTVTDPLLPPGHPLVRRPTDPSAARLAFVVSTPASGRAGELAGNGASPAPVAPAAAPYTPPPVAASTPGRNVATPPPLLKDPAIRMAGLAAMVFGAIVGTSYGWLQFGEPPKSAQAATVAQAPASPALPVATALARPEVPADAPSSSEPPALAPPAASAAPLVARQLATTEAKAPAPSPAPRRTEPPAEPVKKPSGALSPSDAEIKRRMQALSAESKPQASPAASSPRPKPRSPGSSIF